MRPDVIISDWRLPGFNGVDFVRRVRAASRQDLAIIFMTGDISAREIDAAKLTNCAVLHKPVSTEKLISLIETLSARKHCRSKQ